jgi:hypothetical protein
VHVKRRDLTRAQSVELARHVRRVKRLETQLELARAELARAAARAAADGAGVRAIATQVESHPSDAHKLIRVGRELEALT